MRFTKKQHITLPSGRTGWIKEDISTGEIYIHLDVKMVQAWNAPRNRDLGKFAPNTEIVLLPFPEET